MDVAHDIDCPACGYSLRGLAGPALRCPECGKPCDIAELILRRRWFSTNPGYVKLAYASVLFVPAAAMLVLASWLLLDLSVTAPWTFLFGLAPLVAWAALVRSAVGKWPFGAALKMTGQVQGLVLLNLTAAAILSASLIGLLVSVLFLGFLERDGSSAILVFAACLLAAPASYKVLLAARRIDGRLGRRFAEREREMRGEA